ncbi:hypothetical protein [Rhodoferax antarcticus]|uniref:hypothetical protein n=1 Tax=Rhodoferax antarcticus TaxID=81479 RepID=UPI00111530E5|nr:hypothetical protein [Rhodoferax antarcticus]
MASILKIIGNNVLPFLDLIYLGAMMSANIMLQHPQEFTFPPQREAITAVKLHREWWRDEGKGKCYFTGVMVPFVRDWPQTVKHGGGNETVLPPEPDKTAGHAFLSTQKFCQGKPMEKIFRAGFIYRVKPEGQSAKQFPAYDMLAEKPENYPNWLAQVVSRVERVALTDPAAKEFMDVSVEQLEKAFPNRIKTREAAEAGAASRPASDSSPPVLVPPLTLAEPPQVKEVESHH